MKKILMIISTALAIAACGGQKQARVPAFNLDNLDTTVSPKVDFYAYSVGGWQKANPLKPEFARFGSFDVLRENNVTRLNDLFAEMAKMKVAKGTIEQKMTDEDAYWGANLAILEMMKSGTTCFNDMQMNIMQTTRAVKESGMRAVISRGLVGSGNDEAGASRLKQAYEERDAFKDCDRLTFRLGPHAPYTCDEAFLRIVAEEAKKNNMGIHMHLSESKTEIENCRKDYGCSPIELAERTGLFEVPFIAAHCVQIDEKDMDILAKHNVSVVTNPASNMKLGNGFAPVPEMMAKGINICLGTDGAASNNALNMIHEMSLLTLIHKGTHQSPQCVSAQEAFRMATINGAKALSLENVCGSIEAGKKADLVIMDLKRPSMWPNNNPIAALSYSANGTETDTVIIDGQITMEGGRVLTMDEERIYYETEKIMERIGK